MKKLQKSAELCWLFGVIFVALGVAICGKANLGVSMIAAPAFVISEALVNISGFFTVGVTEYLIQGLLLIILCINVRKFKWTYLLAFAVAVIYGYVLNLFIWIFDFVSIIALWQRWFMLILGDVITAFGVACFFRTYLPLQVYELYVSELCDRYKLKTSAVKWGFDISLLIVSVVLALIIFGDAGNIKFSELFSTAYHSIGLGTVITALINSPLIALMGKAVDIFLGTEPLFPKLKNALEK